jgi:hypothetical protein
MELDDLKKRWKQIPVNKITNTDIMELIQHKSYGPVAALKKAYKKQIIVMLLLPFLLLATNLDDISKPLTSVLFWAYVAFCLGVVIYASYNYRVVSKMESMDGMVKENLEKQVTILETRLKNMFVGLRMVLLVLIILTEVMPYFQYYRMLDKWHSLHPLIRFGSYAVLVIYQYFVGKWMLQRKFGGHIAYLKNLVKEIQ